MAGAGKHTAPFGIVLWLAWCTVGTKEITPQNKKVSFRIAFWCTVLANLGGLTWLHTPQGKTGLRNGLFQIENFTMTHVKSEKIVATVFFLTKYRPQVEVHIL